MIKITPALAGAYNLFSDYSKDVLGLTAQDLLDVAQWVEEHRKELEKQANGQKQVERLLEELSFSPIEADIPVGADLSLVIPRFLVWLLSDPEHGTMRLCSESGKEATEIVVALYQRIIEGDLVVDQEWHEVLKLTEASTDESFVYAYAAAYAEDDNAYAAAYDSASDSAAAYANETAVHAIYAALYGNACYAYVAYAARAAAHAHTDARQMHYQQMHDKLLDLLRERPAA